MIPGSRLRGFTLIELMTTAVLLGMFCASTTGILSRVYRADQLAQDYVDDLDHLRRALSRLEADARIAKNVEDVDGLVRLHLPETTVDYSLKAGVLERAVGRDREVVARRIGILRARRVGACVHLCIGPERRVVDSAETPFVSSTIHLRNR